MTSPVDQRIQRIKLLERSVKLATQENGCASLKMIQASWGIDHGLRKQKVREYLSLLEEAGFIKVVEDEVTHLHPNDG